MTSPSRNDIRTAAIHFVHQWKDETSERGEAQSFWTDFATLTAMGVDISAFPNGATCVRVAREDCEHGPA